MSRAKDLATMIFRRSAGYVRKWGILTGRMASSPDAEETLTTFDGLKLHVETFDATPPTRAAVVMVHGFSAHCGLFRHVPAALAAAGFAVTAFDCRGHGRSEGRHGYVRRFSDYADDLGRVIARARDRSPGGAAACGAWLYRIFPRRRDAGVESCVERC